jgi:outer membrane receptor for ferrienterochelin and colicin
VKTRAGIVCLAAALASAAMAGTTGKIAGRVIDPATGQALAGANVMVTAVLQGGDEVPLDRIQGAAADADGDYFIINLPPGRYVVRASMMGFGAQARRDVKVSVDYTTTLDFQLRQEALQMNSVTVTAEREKIRKDLTASAAVVDADAIGMMPVTSINDVLDLQAGMVRDAGGGLHIRGGRSSEIAYLIDGVPINDPMSRTSGLTVDNQAVEELQAITGTFNAEYGQALSGVINVVTRRGSEKWQGSVRAYSGDYYSTDRSVYSVMNDREWALAAARAMTTRSKVVTYGDRIYTPYWGPMPDLEKKATLDSFDPLYNRDLEANVGGPVPFTGKRMTVFASARWYRNQDYQQGRRYFMPWGFQRPALADSSTAFTMPDGRLVPLGWDNSLSVQSKLNWRLGRSVNLSYGLYGFDHSYRGGSQTYKYNPEGTRKFYDLGVTHIVTWNHVLSPSTFYELKASRYDKHHENYLYENPADPRYVPYLTSDVEQYVYDKRENPDVSLTGNTYDFAFWGNDTQRGTNDVEYQSLQFDLTSQLNRTHQVKLGAAGTFHRMMSDYVSLQFSSDYKPMIMPVSSPYHSRYERRPREFSAYVQDKIESKEIIFNVGLRFDYFNSNGDVLADPADPQIYNPFNPAHIVKVDPDDPSDTLFTVAERRAFWFRKASAKMQLSPRFGLSFPITDRGVIHFSYGHFFQNPAFSNLYENPEFEIYGAGTSALIGNADLNAERTVMYEVGLQQALGSSLTMHVTGFYRDIRDWVGTGTPIDTYGGRTTYVKFVNKDYGSAKGVTLSSDFRTGPFMATLDYTFMTAEGTQSDVRDAYNDLQAQKAPRIQMIPLAWDQRHTLNTVLTFHRGGTTASLVGQASTGLPYTPTFARGEVSGSGTFSGLRENSESRPTVYNFDLRLSREIRVAGLRLELFTNVYNLFDRRNVNGVYTDTGEASYTLEGINYRNRVVAISDVNEYFAQPGMYTPPRSIQIGVTVGF